MAGLPVESSAYRTAMHQRDVWVQALAMNDTIKATAPAATPPQRSFVGGGGSFGHTLTSTTTASMSIDYAVTLETGLNLAFGVELGGSGVSGGGELKMRNEYGKGETGSNSATNTMSYHLEDDDSGADAFFVNIKKDYVLGTFVFELDTALSRTSCPYEGGYKLERPQIWVGAMDQSSMSLQNVPVGTQAIFPIYACNKSNYARTYKLDLDGQSNPNGAIISGYNGITSSSSVLLTLPPNACDANVGYIYLSQPAPSVLTFNNIRLRLSSNCGDDIKSSVLLSAHFGEGSVPIYCIPESTNGTSDGDYVDGVQIGSINNTGTGGLDSPTYVDYSAQFSTDLSRNAQSMITITSGSYSTDRYAAWIDYNRNGEFDADEMLGTFQSTDPHQAHDIQFTVPATAVLGSTTLRVRGAYPLSGDPDPLDPCHNYSYGETEDYAIVINADTPQDCLGANNGPALPGTPCDDGNSSTVEDMYNANCECVGTLITAVTEGDAPKVLFSVRPNPSTGIFQLNNPTDAPARVEVRDALGRVVIASTTVTTRVSTLDLSNVSAGIYQLIVEQEDRRDVIKIMVRR